VITSRYSDKSISSYPITLRPIELNLKFKTDSIRNGRLFLIKGEDIREDKRLLTSLKKYKYNVRINLSVKAILLLLFYKLYMIAFKVRPD